MPRQEAFNDPARIWVVLLWFGLFSLFAGFLWYTFEIADGVFDEDDDDDGLGLLPPKQQATHSPTP